MVELMRGKSPVDVVGILNRQRMELRNGIGGTAEQTRDAFLRNVEVLDAHLAQALRGWSWQERLYSARYGRIFSEHADGLHLTTMVNSEVSYLEHWLSELSAALRVYVDEDEAADQTATRAVLDTNVYLHYELFDEIDWPGVLQVSGHVRIILPMVVLRELDQQKNIGRKPANQQARRVLRRIQELIEGHGRGPVAVGEQETIEVARDLPGHVPHPVADEELLDRVEAFEGRPGGELVIVTGDLSMRIRAGVRGLRTLMVPDAFRLSEDSAS